MRQLVYAIFIINNNASFHFWWEENLVKYQKFSNYYDHDYQQNFIFLFMSLLTPSVVKNSPILAGIYFYLSRTAPQIKLESLSLPRLEKSLSSKTICTTFVQLMCSDFRLGFNGLRVTEIAI